jgi:hypothetical protein
MTDEAKPQTSSRMRRWFLDPILAQLKQGAAPEALADAVAAGLLAGTLVARAGGVEHPPSRGAWHPVGADGKPSA